MKNMLPYLLVLISLTVNAQTKLLEDSTLFDFWVGDWNLEWINADGSKSYGTNKIEKTLDGKVIQENFRDPKGDAKGISISVYNTKQKTWHQAWADNGGSYYDFEGALVDGKPVFRTKEKEVNGNKIIQRMVFYNIKPNSLTWDWELTKDGGKTWTLQWRILYSRKQ